MVESAVRDVAVVGGGIGGLAAALAVARAGRQVHLIEQADEFREIGAGLQLGPNAMRSLDRLGVFDHLAKSAVFPTEAVVRDAITGAVLTRLDLGRPFLQRYGYPYVVAHRHDVLDVLVNACRAESRIQVFNGRRVVDVFENEDAAEIEFEDGTRWRTNLVVGADGIRSRVRRLLDISEPTFSGHIAYRGAVPISDVTESVSIDEVRLWIGPGMHLIQYPVRAGSMYNQVAVYERPGLYPDPVGDAAELYEAFSGATDSVRRAVDLIDTSRSWPVHDRTPLESWGTGRSVLIGDAAHAMLQYLGQGACQALEDALELGAALERHPGDHLSALKAYEQVRMPVASRCQTAARPWGALWHSADPTVVALRDRVFRMRDADDYTELDWLYAERTSTLQDTATPRLAPRYSSPEPKDVS